MLSGVKIEDIHVGDGPEARKGMIVFVRYDGYLNRGDKFQEGVEYSWRLGQRNIIAGLDAGVVGMRVGGRRRIRVSPHLAYRDKGVPGTVPANAVLVFEVELLDVRNDDECVKGEGDR